RRGGAAAGVVIGGLPWLEAGAGARLVAGPGVAGVDLPAVDAELLGLLDHVGVVLGRGLVGRRDAGSDLDRELLERRALDGGEELEGRGRETAVDVRLHVVDHRDRKSTRLNSSHVKISYA